MSFNGPHKPVKFLFPALLFFIGGYRSLYNANHMCQ